MNQIAQFSQDQINAALVSFVPAQVQVSGKTATEKRLSVIKGADESVILYASSMKGKVGTEARNGLAEIGFNKIAKQAASGNYKPLAQALAIQLGENVYITTRASFESLGDRFLQKMDELELAGKKWTQSDKLSSKYATLAQCLEMVNTVQECVTAIFNHRNDGEQNVDGILGHNATA